MPCGECGTLRILFAAFVSVIGKKVFRKRAGSTKVAGYKARSIDGPCHNTIPPLQPLCGAGTGEPRPGGPDIKARIGFETCIVDINDLEGQILGVSSRPWTSTSMPGILKDNPLGQDDQQTPMGIIGSFKCTPPRTCWQYPGGVMDLPEKPKDFFGRLNRARKLRALSNPFL